jgi:hypothetical protein
MMYEFLVSSGNCLDLPLKSLTNIHDVMYNIFCKVVQNKKSLPTLQKGTSIMTQASYQQRNQERLAQAITSVKIYEEFGFATVASTSEPNKLYFVDFNKNFYATACSCIGNADHGYDCIHALAFDRAADSIRPDFYTMHGIQRLASPAPIVETPQRDGTIEVERVHEDGTRKHIATIKRVQPAPVETVPVVEVMAQANEAMVQFDRDADPNAYDILAETKKPTSYNFNSLGYPSGAYRKLDSK